MARKISNPPICSICGSLIDPRPHTNTAGIHVYYYTDSMHEICRRCAYPRRDRQ